MNLNNPYSGRKPKSSRQQDGDQALRRASKQPGEYRADSPAVQRGSYDVKDGYLRGKDGGEAHPFYIRSGRKR